MSNNSLVQVFEPVNSLRRRLLSLRNSRNIVQHSTSLLDEPFTELNIATEQRTGRSPGFLLDPFICEAVRAKGLFPQVPTSKEFAAKGLVLDSEELKTEIQTLLSRANAPLSKESLYTGVGKIACFSPALHQYLMANFQSPLRQKIRCFLSHGQLIEQERYRAASRAQNSAAVSASDDLPTNQPFNTTALQTLPLSFQQMLHSNPNAVILAEICV